MRFVQISLAFVTVLSLLGWAYFRKPYSPTETLTPVSYTAFEVWVPTEAAGQALAQAAGSWKGVTASAYNGNSGLLAVSHTAELREDVLLSRLQMLSSNTVSKKKFPEPVGPKCPVPHEALALLPTWLLTIGAVSALILALSLSYHRRGAALN